MTVPSPEWAIGEVIDDLYEVAAKAGEGGFGVVYQVHHRGWNVDLAVKTPLAKWVSSEAALSDFETEAQTCVELGLHANVVACVYVRRIGELPRVFAEWVDGGSRRSILATAESMKSPMAQWNRSRSTTPRQAVTGCGPTW
jgi:eukaryotic-like serine/threonine-protein kinase